MSRLPPPATGVELYLEAILGELRVIRVALVAGTQVQVAVDEALGKVADAVHYQPGDAPTSTSAPTITSPAKRTRTRTRGAGT